MSDPLHPFPSVDCDLLVIGSGAGGLATAVTAAWHGLSVIVVEKAPVLGGASAWSGGWMWIPCNPLARRAGIVEPLSEPRRYLEHELGERFDPVRVDAFLKAGPEMVAFFEQYTSLQFVDGNAIADIHGSSPGAGTGGRSVIAAPISAYGLGRLLPKLRHTLRETAVMGMPIMAGPDLAAFLSLTRSWRSTWHVTRRVAAHCLGLLLKGRATHLVNGVALIARLAKSAEDLGVLLWPQAPARRLIQQDGRVTGAEVVTPKGRVRVHARRGVVLATGGFAHDEARRRALLPRTPTGQEHLALPPQEVSGDGLRLGESVGGVVATDLASPAAWCPVSKVPYPGGAYGHFPHIIDRGKPGVFAVLANGERFVNEADGYYDYTQAMIDQAPGDNVVSWLICDHRFLRRYGLGIARPFPFPVEPMVRCGYLKRGATITELAHTCGIDAQALERTLIAFNEHARTGNDPQFGRGTTPYNRKQGDPRHGPNPCVAPLQHPPFYAVEVRPGSFGTFAGLDTDAQARVLNAEGTPVQGLYAVGTDMASIMGGYYPAGGINLGPAMTFGYIAGRHAAGAPQD